MTLLLGIDLGTSSAKAILFDPETVRVLAVAGQEYPIHKPAPDRAEQNPEEWWNAVVTVIRKVMADAASLDEKRSISAIGLTGQMHGVTLVDANRRLLHPSIIWADQRSASMIEPMIALLGTETYTAIAGTLPAAGFMGPTLLWLAKHEPHLLENARHVILPKDYIRLRLTGEIATDISDAAATGLINISQGTWSDMIIQAAGLPRDIFPPILPSTARSGELTPEAAQILNLEPGIPVVAGCADQPAQAVANGLIKPGVASVTTGSGGQVFIPVKIGANEPIPTDPRVHVFNHAVPDMCYILGAILTAGLALRWFRNLVGLGSTPDAYQILSAEAASISPGANGLIFLPYLAGERSPLMDPLARGGFIGLSYYHSRGHMARAVMEGVAFALRQTLEVSLSLSAPVERVIAAGGGAESDVWRQIQADVFGLPLQRTLLAEQTCIGAAVLAGVGTGLYSNLDEACRSVARYGEITEPGTQRQEQYNALYAQFLELYPRLKEDFHHLTRYGLQ